jgi:small basic protein
VYLIPVVALLIGVCLATLWKAPITGWPAQYIAVACLAGLDTVCGGIRSALEGKFYNTVFITGFFSNIIIAFGLAWLGNRIFVDLFLAVALVLGARIFTNLSLIRRYLITRYSDAQERKRLESLAAQASTGQSSATLGQADTTV